MTARIRQPWFTAAVLVGALYCVVGVVLAAPASHVRVWRLAAWAISAAVYAAHIGYEHFRLRNPLVRAALHVAVAVGIGGFALAFAATVHSLFAPPNYERSRFALALVVWPFVTGVPAFLVALAAAAVLSRLPRKRPAE
jgi:hypothetical protein